VKEVFEQLKRYDNDDEPVEFALFNKRQLVLTTSDYEDDITQIMIGEAIRIKAMNIPKKVLEKQYNGYYAVYQNRSDPSEEISFEKIDKDSNQAVQEF
jgi:hypothetical protein